MNSIDTANQSYRILIVDDNDAIHADLRKILAGEAAGPQDLLADEELLFQTVRMTTARFEIDSAYQGQEGLAIVERALAENRPYAMAFVDVRMPPGWDGVETVRRIWKISPDLQVVICTAYSDHSWDDIVRQLGQSDSLVILKKPFDNIEVIQLAHALTRKWTASREAKAKHQDLERMVQEAMAELTYHANHDWLTDLPNRRLFADRLEQVIAMARRHGEMAALLYMDLDGFKVVNDTLGHAVGDQLLREVVNRLKAHLRQCDTLARMGGDEFTLIAADLAEPEGARQLAQRVLDVFREAFQVNGNELFITASVGMSTYPKDGHDMVTLLRNADTAMYEAKRQGKNRAAAYTREMGQAATARMEVEIQLRSALEKQELLLYYQPLFALGIQRLVRFEALLRWEHPVRGIVPPGQFIPIAEESGLIVPIGTWVMTEACRAAREWQKSSYRGVPVSVNVSIQQFTRPDFVDTVLGILKETLLDPALLELELTETLVMRNPEEVAPKIAALRGHGISVSIDDFGTGYSSFAYLQQLPVDAVKIDRSFIEHLESIPRAQSVVRGMVTLAHGIGLRVVVEGVETPGQLESLCGSGADEAQGFLLGRPAPLEQHATRLLTPKAALREADRPAAMAS
jgi:diguanylate cyclase (GGDEF)-like protein